MCASLWSWQFGSKRNLSEKSTTSESARHSPESSHIAALARRTRARTMRARPESFGVEELFGNGNDNVPVKGDFRVRLITHGHALQIVTRVPLSFSDRGTLFTLSSIRVRVSDSPYDDALIDIINDFTR